jgi:hypothetical protein
MIFAKPEEKKLPEAANRKMRVPQHYLKSNNAICGCQSNYPDTNVGKSCHFSNINGIARINAKHKGNTLKLLLSLIWKK